MNSGIAGLYSFSILPTRAKFLGKEPILAIFTFYFPLSQIPSHSDFCPLHSYHICFFGSCKSSGQLSILILTDSSESFNTVSIPSSLTDSLHLPSMIPNLPGFLLYLDMHSQVSPAHHLNPKCWSTCTVFWPLLHLHSLWSHGFKFHLYSDVYNSIIFSIITPVQPSNLTIHFRTFSQATPPKKSISY